MEYLSDTRRRQNLLRHTPYDELERRLKLNERCNHRLLIEKQTPEQLLKDIPDCSDYIAYPAPYTFMQQWAAAHLRKSKASESQVKESVLFAWRLAYDNYPTWRGISAANSRELFI